MSTLDLSGSRSHNRKPGERVSAHESPCRGRPVACLRKSRPFSLSRQSQGKWQCWAPSTFGRRIILEVGGWRLGVGLGRLRSSPDVCWRMAAKRGRKKFRRRRMRLFFRVTRASGASDIGDGCGRGAGTLPRNELALGRRAGRVRGVVWSAWHPSLTACLRPRRAKIVFWAFFTLRRVRRCAV